MKVSANHRRRYQGTTHSLVAADRDHAHITSEKDRSSLPGLRRSGSSSDDLSFYEDDYELWEESKQSSILSTVIFLFHGITADFCHNGLPWQGPECRSEWAGLSGVLYALPALVSSGHPYDQIMWPMQACFSILADYFYICDNSFWHGVDRYFAIFNVVAITVRACLHLRGHVALLVILPVSCYIAANRAKNRKDLRSWHLWHCLWHVLGGPLACLVMFMIHNCSGTTSSRNMEGWCDSRSW